MSIALVAGGCGKNNNSSAGGPGGGPVGSPGYLPGITPAPNGGIQILFSGSRIYDDVVRITGGTAGFGAAPFQLPSLNPALDPNVNLSGLALGSGGLPVGANVMSGSGQLAHSAVLPQCSMGAYAQGSTIQVSAQPLGYLDANVVGAINLTPQFIQNCLGTTSVQGLAIDLYPIGAQISGTAYICTAKDSGGNCYGASIAF